MIFLTRHRRGCRTQRNPAHVETLRSNHLATMERVSPPKLCRDQDALRQAAGSPPVRKGLRLSGRQVPGQGRCSRHTRHIDRRTGPFGERGTPNLSLFCATEPNAANNTIAVINLMRLLHPLSRIAAFTLELSKCHVPPDATGASAHHMAASSRSARRMNRSYACYGFCQLDPLAGSGSLRGCSRRVCAILPPHNLRPITGLPRDLLHNAKNRKELPG